jgi:ABC-type dipeptide/oligopeptide/nickel transport system permease component
MLSYIARRLLVAIPTLIGVATISFMLLRLIPGDPARVMAGPAASAQTVERLRHQFGLDQPVLQQYLNYIGKLLRGDLGTSARTGTPVIDEITARAPFTVELAIVAIVIAALVGTGLGVLASLRRNGYLDTAVTAVSVIGVSMPVYWVGLLLILTFAVHLRWFPAAGADTPTSYILPGVTLSLFAIGFISRQVRASMIEVLGQDFIRSSYAKGLGRSAVVLRHGLRNALLPVTTVIGLQFGQMLGGAILTETIFAWPGVGRYLVDSISSRDYAAVQGVVFLFAVALIVINLVTDILYSYIDPRIRYG